MKKNSQAEARESLNFTKGAARPLLMYLIKWLKYDEGSNIVIHVL